MTSTQISGIKSVSLSSCQSWLAPRSPKTETKNCIQVTHFHWFTSTIFCFFHLPIFPQCEPVWSREPHSLVYSKHTMSRSVWCLNSGKHRRGLICSKENSWSISPEMDHLKDGCIITVFEVQCDFVWRNVLNSRPSLSNITMCCHFSDSVRLSRRDIKYCSSLGTIMQVI